MFAARFFQIQRPDKLSAQDYPKSVTLYAVLPVEVCPPAGQEPIHWRLLTSHRVVASSSGTDGVGVLNNCLPPKNQAGLNLEATLFESVAAIQRLTVLALSVAVRTRKMVEGRDNPDLPAPDSFSNDQQQCLCQITPTLVAANSRNSKIPILPSLCLGRLGLLLDLVGAKRL